MSWANTLQIVLASVIGSAVAVWIAYWLGKRQRLYELRSAVLRELIGRKGNVKDPEFLAALSIVPIVFHKNEEIRKKWEEYRDAVTPPKEDMESCNQKFVDLVLSICDSLNIKAKKEDVLIVFR